jgi:hypothetical protein
MDECERPSWLADLVMARVVQHRIGRDHLIADATGLMAVRADDARMFISLFEDESESQPELLEPG